MIRRTERSDRVRYDLVFVYLTLSEKTGLEPGRLNLNRFSDAD